MTWGKRNFNAFWQGSFCITKNILDHLIQSKKISNDQVYIPQKFKAIPIKKILKSKMSRLVTKPTKMTERPAKTQVSLGIRLVWSESLLSAWRNLGSLATHWTHNEGGCPGWSQSSLGAQINCWFCHEAAHIRDVHISKCFKRHA